MMKMVTVAAVFAASLQTQTPVFRSGVEVVRLDVSATRGGVPIPGLTSRNFALTDNGVAQDVESATLEKMPLTVTLVLDTSASVSGERLTHLIAAGQALVGALRPQDRSSLITFSQLVELRVPVTEDTQQVRSALASLTGMGATALRDAVHTALQLTSSDQTRPLILVFTDGHDTASWLTVDDVVETARRAGVVTHAVRVESDPFLDRLVEAAGGRTWSATSDRQLRQLFTKALEEMRARYLLSYTPRGVKTPGWHDIKVKLQDQRGEIVARPGYFVVGAAGQ
jgi:VWFA-related protein